METQQKFDYTGELENLPKNQEWFKPVIGTQQVTFAGEAEMHLEPDKKDEAGNTVQGVAQIRVPVKSAGRDCTWSVTKAGVGSLYAQIMQVAKNNGNRLSGLTVTLVAKDTGRTFNGFAVKDYTILEAQIVV